ncbi:MAG: diguanylate cyclase [Thermoleophilia bacterium]
MVDRDEPRPDHGMRALVAVRDTRLRARLGTLLAAGGYEVLAVADEAAARRELDGGDVAAVIGGAAPDGDLAALTRLARTAPGHPAIVAVVPGGDADVARIVLEGGADDYVTEEALDVDLVVRIGSAVTGERRRAAEERASLHRIAVAVARGASPATVFDLVAEEVARVHRGSGGAVVRFLDDEAVYEGRWTSRPEGPQAGDRLPLDAPLPSCRVARTGRAARCDDLRGSAGAAARADGYYGAVSAPVRVGDRLWGAVTVTSTVDERLPPATEGRLERFAELVALAIDNALTRAELSRRAATDPLTGLVNRGVFEERLAAEVARSRRHGNNLALAIIDLDAFKSVNDRHGHVAGDEVLREMGRRFGSLAREADVVARLGGEEFAWLMPETDGMEAWHAAERLRAEVAALRLPEVGGITVSAGVCDLERAGSPVDLYRNADAALYWAKRNGRDVVFLYSPRVMRPMESGQRAMELRRGQSFHSVRMLARAIDARSPATRRHSERVAALATSIAETIGWTPERAALLLEAALVHDVGRVAIPDAAADGSGGGREDDATYAVLGSRMLAGVLTDEQVAWVRHHRDPWRDAPDLPEGALILHVADAWDTMTGAAGDGGVEAALDACRAAAGHRFWPRAVGAVEILWEAGVLSREAPVPDRRAAAG